MRRSWRRKCAVAALAGALVLAGQAASAQVPRADPLALPAGPLPAPEDGGSVDAAERLESAARALAERGYRDMPYLAWALVETSGRSGSPALAERAVSLAPDSPVVWLEAARLWRVPGYVLGGLAAVPRSFPALLWCLVAVSLALGAGLLAGAAVIQVLAAVRGIPLAGHALGHLARIERPPAWPGVLAALAVLASLAALGVGPVLLIALAGCAGGLWLRPGEVAIAGIGLAVSGLILGPGLDAWTRAATSLEHMGPVATAWRVERGHLLPGDEERLEKTLERRPGDALVRLALGAARIREGAVESAQVLLSGLEAAEEPEFRAVARSQLAALELARGEVAAAVALLEEARNEHATVEVLFNLSQAYGRALRLSEQAVSYGAARDLDPGSLARFDAGSGDNLHQFLMPVRLAVSQYLQRALGPSPRAARLARALRARLLGRSLPDGAWMVLPVLGLLCAGLRRGDLARCSRCERTLCGRCVPENLNQATCVRCVRLFERRADVDRRVREEHLQRDRKHQRRLAHEAALLALVAPGADHLRHGNAGAGTAWLLLGAVAAALVAAPSWIAAPWEVGPLARSLGWAGWLGLACAYAAGGLRALDLVRRSRAPA